MKKGGKIIKRYVKTLFTLVKLSEMEQVITDISRFNLVVKKSKEVRDVLASPLFDETERIKVVGVIAGKYDMTAPTVKFLNKVVELRAHSDLPIAVNLLTKMYLDAKKMSRAVITTSIEINEALKKRLGEALKKAFNTDFELVCNVDAAIGGGIVAQIGANRYDLSTNGQLRLLRDDLLKG